MAVRGMYFLNCGLLTVDQGSVTARNRAGEKVDIPVIPVLIDTDDGYVLFDTGLDPQGFLNPVEVWGTKASSVKELNEDYDIRKQLQKIGLTPKDIKYVVNSHLHWDHCGGNRFFSESLILVQKSEYRNAMYPDQFEAPIYMKDHFNHPLNYQLIEGDMKVVDGVYITSTPGHTVGHQSLIVDLKELGRAILVGDVVYSKENIEKKIPPGIVSSFPQAVESMNRLIAMCVRDRAKLFITHDPEFWMEHEAVPFCYR
jgi:glyoxylase-like metal-dependent hydrolase (beta-lactamase superfamily II)